MSDDDEHHEPPKVRKTDANERAKIAKARRQVKRRAKAKHRERKERKRRGY